MYCKHIDELHCVGTSSSQDLQFGLLCLHRTLQVLVDRLGARNINRNSVGKVGI